MKTSAKTGLLRRATALALAVVLSIPSAFAAAGDKKIQTSTQLVSGLSYQNTVTANNGSRVESFSLELEPGAAAQPILLQSAGTVYGAATINKAVSRAESLGYHVLGAINTDFFATSTGVPMGIVIEDGDYQSSPENEAAMTVTDGKVQLVESPKIQLTLTNQTNGTQIHPQHLNKVRAATGGMYLMNRHFSTVSTRTSTSGWYVRMKLVDGSEGAKLALNTDLTLQVTEMLQSSYPLDIGEDEYVLTADDASGYADDYRLDEKLRHDVASARADAHAQAYLARALGHRHQHDVHDADAAHEKRDACYAGEQQRHHVAGGVEHLAQFLL